MNIRILSVLTLFVLFGAVSCKKSDKSPANPKLKTKTDSLSYALGALVGQDLKNSGFKEMDYKILNAAMKRAMNGDSLLMDKTQATMILQSFAMAEMKKKSGENAKAADDFMAKNKTKDGVVTTASGLQYKIIKAGTGAKPTAAQKVRVHYTGKLVDGKVFDSSVERGEPAEFNVGEVIPGWTEALQLMPVGSKWELYLPPNLGYGEQGNQSIPGNSVLIFEVELLDIVAPAADTKPAK